MRTLEALPRSVCTLALWTEIGTCSKSQYVQYPPICTNNHIFFSAMLAVKERAGSEKLVGEASRRENNMWKSINSQVGSLLSSPCVQPFSWENKVTSIWAWLVVTMHWVSRSPLEKLYKSHIRMLVIDLEQFLTSDSLSVLYKNNLKNFTRVFYNLNSTTDTYSLRSL